MRTYVSRFPSLLTLLNSHLREMSSILEEKELVRPSLIGSITIAGSTFLVHRMETHRPYEDQSAYFSSYDECSSESNGIVEASN